MSIADSRHVDKPGYAWNGDDRMCSPFTNYSVHYLRTLVPHCLVFTTESPEHRKSYGTITKVNCEATIFGIDVGWITGETFVFIFSIKNPWIQCVK